MKKINKNSPKPISRARENKPETLREIRNLTVEDMELRSSTGNMESDQEYVDGVGVVYDKEVEIWDGYFEKIRSGAFDKCLKRGAEIKSFFNHNPDYVLSTTRSDPKLVIEDTPTGLRFYSPIPDTSYGRDLVENLKRKNVRGASFSFSVPESGSIWREENGNYYREIVEAEIYEVGPVTNPAYPTTKVKCRSVDDVLNEAREALKPETIVEVDEEENRQFSNENYLELKKLKLNLLSKEL
jgi:HK97 family phage prohead protease